VQAEEPHLQTDRFGDALHRADEHDELHEHGLEDIGAEDIYPERILSFTSAHEGDG
jgi:hypothetical protein